MRRGLYEALDKLGERQKVLAVPPDYTRLPSRAGNSPKSHGNITVTN
jgi:hypothetical protein